MKAIVSKTRKSMRTSARGKRFFATVLVVAMTLAISATALADGGKSSGSAGGAPGGQSQQGGQPGQQPQGGQSSDAQSSATSSTGGGQGQPGNGAAAGINTDKVEEAIAALTDETVQANLTTLLEAYVAAEEAKQTAIAANETDLTDLTSAVTAAKEALETALAAAGVETDDLYGAQMQANDGTGRMQNRPALDTTALSEAIAALEDTDENKASLTALLTAYETALAAETAADTTTLTEDEIAALAEATKTAEQALLEAAKTAGISTGMDNGRGEKPAINTTTISEAIAALEDTDENKASLTALLTAYETALAAETAADTTTLTEDEIAALSEATQTAAQALQEALQNAGISEEPIQDQNRQQNQTSTTQSSGTTDSFGLNVVQEDSTDTDSDTSGIISVFLNWLSTLIN